MIGLADCNNYFVSCERSINPDLNGRAVVVLSNNDGCAIARSNEAKKLGVRMGQPAFELREMIMRGDLIAFSGNHLLYREISLRIHDIFRQFAPRTLDYSVDEAFLDMDGIPDSELEVIGQEICRACMERERIPVTIGFAASKTLAKIATEKGKKTGNRVVVLKDEEEIRAIIDKMPINDLWGVGRRLSKRLYMSGVYTIGDFARQERMWVRSHLGVVGERSWCELHGESCIELEHLGRSRQDSISESRTFPYDIADFDYLRSRMVIYSGHVARRLREMKGQCGKITVFLNTNRFHTEHGYASPTASAVFEPPVSDTSAIANAAVSLLESIFNPSLKYKRGGVILGDITPAGIMAPTLFKETELQRKAAVKSRNLMNAIDKLNCEVGKSVLKLATELTQGSEGHNDGYSSSFGPAKKF